METVKLLRRRSVQATTGLSKTEIYDRMNEGSFPRALKIGPRAVAWPEHEVAAVVRGHMRGLDTDAIRLLVADLMRAREAI